jgi:hypothetical protein
MSFVFAPSAMFVGNVPLQDFKRKASRKIDIPELFPLPN